MNRYIDQLNNKIKQKTERLLCWFGYVGLSLLIRLNQLGLICYGIDLDKENKIYLKKESHMTTSLQKIS